MSVRRSVAAMAMAVICIDAPRLRSRAYNYLVRRLFVFRFDKNHNLNAIRVLHYKGVLLKIYKENGVNL